MLRRTILASAALAALAATGVAAADPAKVMIPAGAGGGWDTTARMAVAAMQASGFKDGAQFTNKGGAAGTLGLADFVNGNKGQDNAVMVMGAIMVGGIVLNKSPVTLDQVTPLARLTNEYNVIAVPANSPHKTIKDLVAALKKDPGAVAVGGGSAGGVDHVTLALIAKNQGIPVAKINYVPGTSGAETVAQLIGAKLAAAISGVSEFEQHAKSGRIRILAVTSDKKIAGLNAPTLKESGVNVVIGNWRGFVGAPGMSAAGKKQWLDRFAAMHKSAAWKETLKKQGWDDSYLAGDNFAKFLDSEKKQWAATLADVGLVK